MEDKLMKKSLIIAAALCFAAFAVYATSHDISTGPLSITSGGEWEVTGTTTANSITVNSPDPVSITFDNVNISGVNCALDIQSGNVTLELRGSSTLVSAGSAGIHVATAASLTIDGIGYLDVTAQGGEGAGIGGTSYEDSGAVIIENGKINANGAIFAAGIGGGGHSKANVTINGGEITAEAGGYAAGIGGGTGSEGQAGTITINGGYVIAKAGAGAGIGCGDEGGYNVYPAGTITITGGTIEASSENGAGIGAGKGGTDGLKGRGPSIYISGGSIFASSKEGQAVGKGASGDDCPAPSTGVGGNAVYLATVESALTGHTTDYTFTTTKDGTAYAYSYAGSGHLGTSDLYFYLPNGEYTVKSTNGRDFRGTISNGPGTLTRYIPEKVYLHIGDGDIEIEDEIGAVQGTRIVGRYGNYIIDGTTENGFVSIYSGDNPTITLDNASIGGFQVFKIEGGDVNLILNGSNSLLSGAGAGLHVAPGTSVTISGTGSLTATSQGGAGAGIGGNSWESSGEIIINSGTITATGSQYAAGIGGGEHGKANVTINGGSVTATAGRLGAGIGGGTGWEGAAGTITINGGYVKAIGGEGAGIGNGDEGGQNEIGEITITGGTIEASASSGAGIGAGNGSDLSGRVPAIYISGGSIKATSSTGSPIGPGSGKGDGPSPKTAGDGEEVYLAALTDATAPTVNSIYGVGDGEVSFTATRKSDSHSYGYEGEGHSDTYDLYFYLPEGEYTITGNNGKTYAGRVSSSGSTIAPTPEPAMIGLALLALALCLRRK